MHSPLSPAAEAGRKCASALSEGFGIFHKQQTTDRLENFPQIADGTEGSSRKFYMRRRLTYLLE